MKLLLSLLMVLFFSWPAYSTDYIIGDGDVLKISVWGVPALSGPVNVRPDGKITLAVGGDVLASGLSTKELTQVLSELLLDYVNKPIVTVSVEKITNNKVYVAGDGFPSKVVELTGRTTLFRFLCGLENLESGDLRGAYLVRGENKVPVDFYALMKQGDLSRDVPLQAEDIIFIPSREMSKIYVLGAVNDPKFILFRDGMKVLDAILEAGGFNEFAKPGSVTVHRFSGEQIKVNAAALLKGKNTAQNVSLQPGDYVTVGEGLF